MPRLSPLFFIPVAAAIAAVPFVATQHPFAQEASAPAAQTQTQAQPWTAPQTGGRWNRSAPPATNQPGSGGTTASPSTSGSLEQVYRQATAAAVRINVGDSGIGSGFFISPSGTLLTAAHVVLDAPGEALTVTLADGRELSARTVGYDEQKDLAVLQVQGSGFPALKLAAQPAGVGEATVAIGNSRGAFDGGRAGRVTGLNVRLDATFPSGLTASSMPLAPGDSGGPVLNARGEVVGVSDAISEVNGQFSSYFVPVTRQSAIVGQLQAGLRRGVPVLGVSVADARAALNLPGALITGVQPGLGAAQAGLRAATLREYRDESGQLSQQVSDADVIVAVDGRAVSSPADLIAYLRGKAAGDRVTLSVRRGGQTLSVPVRLSAKPVA